MPEMQLEWAASPALSADSLVEREGIRLSVEPETQIVHIQRLASQPSQHLSLVGEDALPERVESMLDLQSPLFFLSPSRWLCVNRAVELPDTGSSRIYDGWVITDLSSRYRVLGLSGSNANTLLMTGTSVNLERECCDPGQYVQTRLFDSPVIIYCVGSDDNGAAVPSPVYRIYVDRSLVEQLWGRLEEST